MSVDDGATWADATLGAGGPRSVGVAVVVVRLDAVGAGEHVLACRARAADGAPDRPDWNLGGYANPAPQRIEVTVTDA